MVCRNRFGSGLGTCDFPLDREAGVLDRWEGWVGLRPRVALNHGGALYHGVHCTMGGHSSSTMRGGALEPG